MKILALAFGFTVVLGYAQGAALGKCSLREVEIKRRHCYTPLIKDLQNKPNADCSIDTYLDCYLKRVVETCTPNLVSDVKKILQQQKGQLEDLLCNKAGLQIPNTYGLDLVKALNSCSKELISIWQANRADNRTCIEYTKTKQCFVKVLKDSKYSDREGIKEVIKLYLDNYNPFCPKNVDISSASHGQISFTKGLVALVISVVLVITDV